MKAVRILLIALIAALLLSLVGCGVQDNPAKEEPEKGISEEQYSITGRYFEEYNYTYQEKKRSDSLFKPEHISWLELREDNTFTFRVNSFEGMRDVNGSWKLEKDENRIYLNAEEGYGSKILNTSYLELTPEAKLIYHGAEIGTVQDGNIFKKIDNSN